MEVRIRDNQGVGTLFMMDGFSQEQIMRAKGLIRQSFQQAAQVVFGNVLQRELPETVFINLGQNDAEELERGNAVRLAEFNETLSNNKQLVFTVREFTVRKIMEQKDLEDFSVTVHHEMIHAADIPMLAKSRQMFDRLRNVIDDEYALHGKIDNFNLALFNTLSVFNRYRGEGVAILGSYLLQKKEFPTTQEMIKKFLLIYVVTLVKAQHRMEGEKENNGFFEDETTALAYKVAAAILLLVLDRRGDVKKELVQKAFVGLNTGDFDLTDEETNEILRASFSLGVAGYIQGLLLLGDDIAPIRPLLEFCAKLQQDWEDDNIEEFVRLVRQPETASLFKTVIKKIIGSRMTVEELGQEYAAFIANPTIDADYPNMKEKVRVLYQMLKNEVDSDRRDIVQWALTYLFDDQDVIHDDVVGLGLIDDMMVIDCALKVLGN